MNYNKTEIKPGIKIHEIQTNKFKTNLVSVFLSTPLTRENVTKNALLAAVLRRGTKNMPSQEMISENLEEMYGAIFNCGIEKIGDNHTLKFYLESINDNFLPNKENILEKSIEMLFEIVFSPLTENESFKKEYVDGEKQNLKQIIESKIDNKGMYALDRTIEEMYKDEPYGLYKFGYIEDLEKINAENLYEYYKQLIAESKIDIFVSGEISEDIINKVKEYEIIKSLNEREAKLVDILEKPENIEVKEIEEKMQITQGKLILGLDVMQKEENTSYVAMLYNAILGGGANSKLFQNVREKASLAYTCGSNYIKRKQTIFIRAGIEIQNYDKALKIIKEQLEDMKNGKFTDEDLQNAKNLIISTIEAIPEEQDTELTYYFGQELANSQISVEEYKQRVEKINKEDIEKLAQTVRLNTVYFLRN
ncbi:MAG: insulinase family protein [Clostridia bacterium]|nr:insulinase family protein [Clostridia bacterium]